MENQTKQTYKSVNYDQVDFSKMDKKKMFSAIVELIKENKMLLHNNTKLESEIKDIESKSKNGAKIEKVYEKKIDDVIAQLCPDLAALLDNDEKMSLDYKFASLVETIMSDKQKYISTITNLKEKEKNYKILLDEMKEKLIKMIENQRNILTTDNLDD
jgi:S-adenosylmethionine:tRNA-ribosyltransferase-isomerase (queuine synthetase)